MMFYCDLITFFVGIKLILCTTLKKNPGKNCDLLVSLV